MSYELGDFRKSISDALRKVGYETNEQDDFDYSDVAVEEKLESLIEESFAVVCLVGKAFGGPSHSNKMVSFTQAEYHFARKHEKPVMVLISEKNRHSREVKARLESETAGQKESQEEHLRSIKEGKSFYWLFRNKIDFNDHIIGVIGFLNKLSSDRKQTFMDRFALFAKSKVGFLILASLVVMQIGGILLLKGDWNRPPEPDPPVFDVPNEPPRKPEPNPGSSARVDPEAPPVPKEPEDKTIPPAEDPIQYASVVLNTEPSRAKVYNDANQYLGMSGEELRLKEGEHNLVLEKEGFEDKSIQIVAEDDRTLNRAFELTPSKVDVQVTSNPAGARITITSENGTKSLFTDSAPFRVSLPRGTVKYRAELKDHETETGTWYLSDSRTNSFQV
ncbi:MAG: PEGA domain-containing protein, partial [Verrucomicrobiota bacterium]